MFVKGADFVLKKVYHHITLFQKLLKKLTKRKSLWNKNIERIYYVYLCRNCSTSNYFRRKVSKKIFEFFGLSVSGRTVNLYRNQVKLKYREPIWSVFITKEAANKRFQFSKHLIENGTCWRNVAFSDEAWFFLGRPKKWVDKN